MIFSLIFYTGTVAQCDEILEHLGAPPKGFVFVDLKSRAVSTPLQLIGTTDPPTLLLNGKPIPLTQQELKPQELEKGEDPNGVWINGKLYPIEGTNGRFYVSIENAEAAVEKLEILIHAQSNLRFKGVVQLNRFFLDAPFEMRTVVNENQSGSTFPFILEGKLPEKSVLFIQEAQFSQGNPGTSKFKLSLSLGTHVISAKLKQADGSERLLNIPVEVIRTEFSPNATVLSLVLPSNANPGEPWPVGYSGTHLSGWTTPNASLLVNAQPVPVDPDGRFELSYYPNDSKSEVQFVVQPPGGPSQTFTKKLICEDCGIHDASWFSPRRYRAGDTYLSLRTIGVSTFTVVTSGASIPTPDGGHFLIFDRNGLPTNFTPALGIKSGVHLSRYFALAGRISGIGASAGGSIGNNLPQNGSTLQVTRYEIRNILEFSLDFSYAPFSNLAIGFGPYLVKSDLRMFMRDLSGNGEAYMDRNNSVLGMQFSIEMRFGLYGHWQLTPELMAAPDGMSATIGEAMARYNILWVEPLCFRYNF